MNSKEKEELFQTMQEEISNVIAKNLPNFDNNIKEDTWKMLEVFLDETIQQLTEEEATATYHGITKAICLNCGKVTTDVTQLEILNDLDPICPACDVHAVAWHTSKGVVVTAQKTTEEDAETERFAILEKENN